MKHVTGLVAIVALMALMLVARASAATPPVYLSEYDPDAYQSMIAFYVDAGFTQADAESAAGSITVDGVTIADLNPTPSPTPTPTPTATPTPEPSLSGPVYLEQHDPLAYQLLVSYYVEAGFTIAEAHEAASKVMVVP